MLKQYPIFKRFQIENIYSKLPEKEKRFLEEYLQVLKARGVSTERKLLDVRRFMLQIIFIFGEDYSKLSLPIKNENIPLKTFRNFLALINSSKLSNSSKGGMLTYFKIFLKLKFPDWSLRFSDFEDVRISSSINEQKINPKNLYSKSDIEKLVRHENSLYWKVFLLVQYEGGLRTVETRLIKWDDIKLNTDRDISEINVFATKTKRARSIFVKEATFYLKKLKEEQENLNQKSVYVFPSKDNLNKPVHKSNVCVWFRKLTQKTLGRTGWNYLLRHSRATELYTLANEGKIAEDTACKFMGHSKNMKNVYLHLDNSKVKEMLKNQVYKLEDVPPEKKAEFENKLKEQDEQLKAMIEDINMLKSRVVTQQDWINQDYDEDFQKKLSKLPKKKQERAKQKIEKFTKMINERN